MKFLRRSLALFSLVLVSGTFVPQLFAQDITQLIADPPGTDELAIPFGFVNLATGDLHLSIPLSGAPQRGVAASSVSAVYDSSLWATVNDGQANFVTMYETGSSIGSGWNLIDAGDPVTSLVAYEPTTAACPTGYKGSTITYQGFFYTDANGASHFINPSAVSLTSCVNIQTGAPEPNQKTVSASALATDGSGYFLTVTAVPGATSPTLTLIGPDGTNLGQGGGYGSATIGETPNGNSLRDLGPSAPVISASGCISTATGKPTRPFPGETGSPFVATSPYVCTLSVPAWDPVAQKTVNAAYLFTYANQAVCTNFKYVNPTPSEVYDYCGGIEVLTNIGLPDGTFYSFEYDTDSTAGHYGRMTSMILPTGGTVFMGYQPVKAGTLAEANGQVTSVTRGTAETQIAYTFPWSPTTGYYYPVTVTYPSHVTNPATGATAQDHTVYSLVAGTGQAPTPITETIKEYSGSSLLLRTTVEDKTIVGFPSSVTTTWNQTGATHAVNYTYGTGKVITKKQEYVNGTLLRTVNTQYQGDTSSIKYQSQYNMWTLPSQVQVLDSGNNVVAQTNYTYDEYSAGYCTTSYPTGLSGIAMLTAVTGALGHDDTRGTSYLARGNATTIKSLTSSSASVTTHNCYDTLGNVTQAIDGRGYATRYSYADNFIDTSCVAKTTPTYGFPTLVTDALGHQTKASYTSCLRTPYATQDANDIAAGRAGTIQTQDIEGRPLCTTYPDGGQSCNSYPTATTIVSTQLLKSGTTHQVNTDLDAFGNPTLTQDLDALQSTTEASSLGDTEGAFTTKTYDGFGRLNSVSIPAFGEASTSSLAEQYAYDALGRITGKWLTTTTTSGSSTPTITYATPYTWTYSGPNVDTYDESGLHHTLSYDTLGRLTKVLEPAPTTNVPTLETDYTYDALNNLQKVNQLGASGSTARVRTFTYDFLSRLVCSSNPETSTTACPTSVATAIPSGVMSFGYDANGNLVAKTDARGITVVPAYDALNRITSETATGIKYAYTYDLATADGVAASNPIGRLVWATNSVNADVHYSYDPMGRVVKQTGSSPQNTAETANPVSAVYDLAGNVTSLTYPDGRTVTQPRDTAGRITSVNYASWGATAVNTPYMTVSTFNPNGQVATSTLGNGIHATLALNNQLEIASVQYASTAATLWSKALTWSPSGNLQLMTDTVKGTARQFSYDDLNRLTLAQDIVPSTKALVANGLNESYSYDSFGNIQQAGNFNFDQAYTAANRLSGYSYDAAGNLLSDGLTNTMQYDANGRVTTDSGTKYYYDPMGNRVGKSGSTSTDIVYFNGQPIARLSAGVWTDLIYGPAGLLAEVPGTQTGVPTYRMTDHLGSLAGILSSTGTVVSLLDHAPFGQVFSGSTSDPYQFTSYERDPESGFDYAGARYFGSSMGRFMSPDPLGPWVADAADPQSWNMYAYARNNPLTNTDPTGYDCVYLNSAGTGIDPNGIDTNSNSGECGDHGGYWVDGTFTSGTVYSNSNDVYLHGYDSSNGQLTDSYSNVVTANGSSPVNTDVFSGPNLFAPLPTTALTSMISSLNRSGQSNKLVGCIVAAESSGNPQAAAGHGSTAKGLMQVNNPTAGDIARWYPSDFGGMSGGQLSSQMTDPATAIVAGTDLLSHKIGSGSLANGLGNYYGSKDPSANAAYAAARMSCAQKE